MHLEARTSCIVEPKITIIGSSFFKLQKIKQATISETRGKVVGVS